MLPHRPVPESLSGKPLFFDPSAQVASRMGGSEFFFSIGAKFVHRVGLMRGMGWQLPFGEAAHGIDYVRVSIRNGGCGTYDMLFGKRHDSREGVEVFKEDPDPFRIETIKLVESVHPSKLREVYDRETTSA